MSLFPCAFYSFLGIPNSKKKLLNDTSLYYYIKILKDSIIMSMHHS